MLSSHDHAGVDSNREKIASLLEYMILRKLQFYQSFRNQIKSIVKNNSLELRKMRKEKGKNTTFRINKN